MNKHVNRLLVLLICVFAFVCGFTRAVPAYAKDTDAAITMHRLYNPYSGEHLYTSDTEERSALTSIGWKYEGVAWIAPSKSSTPVYRLYNKYSGDHHYTTNKNEYDACVRQGWNGEGVGFYSGDAKGVPVYRVYNKYLTAGTHHYTTSKTEYDYLGSIGWSPENIGWYAIKYNYELYVLGSADLPAYTECDTIVYIKTNAPRDSFEFTATGSTSYLRANYPDLNLSSRLSWWDSLYKVDGGYVAIRNYSAAGTYTLKLTQSGDASKTLATYTLKVEDYEAARDAWMDSVLATLAAQPGWSSLDSFDKMSTLCWYLLDNFTYLDTTNNGEELITLAKRNTPFFKSLRWDSYISPAILCMFAEKIGGFDDIHDCYGDYARGTEMWQRYHFLCRVTIGDNVRYYNACPLVGTSEITSYSMVDYADTASFVHYDPGAIRTMGKP